MYRQSKQGNTWIIANSHSCKYGGRWEKERELKKKKKNTKKNARDVVKDKEGRNNLKEIFEGTGVGRVGGGIVPFVDCTHKISSFDEMVTHRETGIIGTTNYKAIILQLKHKF